ncbi:MAG: HAD family phosphatase [Actinobacteria bacterium]|nr:HAD family phosphatase [Actinomycetota bacterium]
MSGIKAVIFDLDGVLIDSEQAWDGARREVAGALGGHWRADATRKMMGMSSGEWSRYMHNELGLPESPSEISRLVVARLRALYNDSLPLMPGAGAAVRQIASRWPLGLASSSNRELIDLVLKLARLEDKFLVTISSEEVNRGKPSPDVYLEAARCLDVDPAWAAAVEDSANGIRAGKAAGMPVIAIPNRALPPEPEALALADRVIDSLSQLSAGLIESLAADCV